jgi:hypothetical protein
MSSSMMPDACALQVVQYAKIPTASDPHFGRHSIIE